MPKPTSSLTFENPFELLAHVKQNVPINQKVEWAAGFMQVAAKWAGDNAMLRDNLCKLAAEVFGFTVSVAREALKVETDKLQHEQNRVCAFVAEEGILAEQVFRPHNRERPTGFLVQNLSKLDDPPEYFDDIKLPGGGKVYPYRPEIVKQMFKLPSTYEEYGDEADLVQIIGAYIDDHVQCAPRTRTIAIMYILMSWVYDTFYSLPYFRALGDFGVGKSRLLRVVGMACYRPIMAAGSLTGPVLFRLADASRGTLVIDEADHAGTELWDDIVKCLNVGFEKDAAVFRMERHEGSDFEVRRFDCFGPKILATRRSYRDAALESRCLTYSLPLVDINKKRIPIFLGKRWEERVAKLRNQLLLWRFRSWSKVYADPYDWIDGLDPRTNQIILPLLGVARNFPAIYKELLESGREFSKETAASRQDSVEGKVAAACLALWDRRPPGENRIALAVVAEQITKEEGWRDFSGHRVSTILKGLKIEGRVRAGGKSYVTFTPLEIARLRRDYSPLDPSDPMLQKEKLDKEKQAEIEAEKLKALPENNGTQPM